MAALTAILKTAPQKIDTVVVDVVLSETHTLSNTITDHPVEEGIDVSDHSRPDPEEVQMECFQSNTPVTGGLQTDRAQKTYDALKKLRDNGTLMTVVTTKRSYTSMMVKQIVEQVNSQNSDGMAFTISFKRVRTVKNKLTTTHSVKDRQGKKVKKGEIPPDRENGPKLLESELVVKLGKSKDAQNQ